MAGLVGCARGLRALLANHDGREPGVFEPRIYRGQILAQHVFPFCDHGVDVGLGRIESLHGVSGWCRVAIVYRRENLRELGGERGQVWLFFRWFRGNDAVRTRRRSGDVFRLLDERVQGREERCLILRL
jgi:hypothetical protein